MELEELENEDLLQEYHDTVHHLGVCSAMGQIDNQQNKEERVLFSEILNRMSTKQQ